MPKENIPERFQPLLASTTLGHLATIDEAGNPQVNPVWFLWDGTHLLLSVKAETVKYRNLRRRPALAISFVGLAVAETTGSFLGVESRTTTVVALMFGWLAAALRLYPPASSTPTPAPQ